MYFIYFVLMSVSVPKMFYLVSLTEIGKRSGHSTVWVKSEVASSFTEFGLKSKYFL
jgi:hypothetical protein